jgi:recombination protein RecA
LAGERKPMPHIPTGIYSLDKNVFGIGGIARGRIQEWYGVEGGGKTTLLYTAIASAQKLFPNEACVLIDTEHATDPSWLAKNGVDLDKLIFHQPMCGEEGLALAEDLIKECPCSLVGIDSVAALVPKAELEGEMGEAHVGRQGRMMSQALRKLVGLVSTRHTALIFTNQIRDVIGGMTMPGMGPRTTTPGGRALKFAASVRLKIARVKTVKVEGEAFKNTVSIKAEKNKLFPPYREVEIDLNYDYGFDKLGNIVSECVWAGIIKKSGAWYSYDGEKLGQGQDSCNDLVLTNLSKFTDLLDKHYETHKVTEVTPTEESE